MAAAESDAPHPARMADQAGLRKRKVMRSLSPMASYLAWSKLGLSGWPSGALRRVGGRVQTPKGWSLVSLGLALISELRLQHEAGLLGQLRR